MSGSLAKAFLDDIVANTDDDTPRLVYADWLEENGQPERAEFIRVQVELERLPLDAPGRPALEARAEDLLTESEERWLAPVPAQLLRWTWRRGFLETVQFLGPGPAADLVRLCAAHPLDETHWSASAKELLECLDMPGLTELPALHLSSVYQSTLLEELASRQAPANLTGLTLQDADPAAVAALPCASALTRLELEYVSLDTLVSVLAAGAWPRLSHFRVSWDGVADSRSLRPLFARPRSGLWRDLALGDLAPDTLPLLVGLSALRRLSLHLSGTPVAPFTLPPRLTDLTCEAFRGEGPLLSALAEADGVERLRRLSLFVRQPLQAEGWAALGRLLGRLRGPVLRLHVLRGCEGFLAGLVNLPHLDRVAGLEGSYVPEPAEMEALFACPALTGLRELEVQILKLREPEVRLLAKAPWLGQLRVLDLRATQMGSRSLIWLLKSPHLRRLTSLSLNNARMNAKALQVLEEWPGLPRLRLLTISPEQPRGAKPLPLRLAGLSPLAVLHVLSSVREKDRQRFRARHGMRWPNG
jgi:uncharacterized protein (TIGR02996 family)